MLNRFPFPQDDPFDQTPGGMSDEKLEFMQEYAPSSFARDDWDMETIDDGIVQTKYDVMVSVMEQMNQSERERYLGTDNSTTRQEIWDERLFQQFAPPEMLERYRQATNMDFPDFEAILEMREAFSDFWENELKPEDQLKYLNGDGTQRSHRFKMFEKMQKQQQLQEQRHGMEEHMVHDLDDDLTDPISMDTDEAFDDIEDDFEDDSNDLADDDEVLKDLLKEIDTPTGPPPQMKVDPPKQEEVVKKEPELLDPQKELDKLYEEVEGILDPYIDKRAQKMAVDGTNNSWKNRNTRIDTKVQEFEKIISDPDEEVDSKKRTLTPFHDKALIDDTFRSMTPQMDAFWSKHGRDPRNPEHLRQYEEQMTRIMNEELQSSGTKIGTKTMQQSYAQKLFRLQALTQFENTKMYDVSSDVKQKSINTEQEVLDQINLTAKNSLSSKAKDYAKGLKKGKVSFDYDSGIVDTSKKKDMQMGL